MVPQLLTFAKMHVQLRSGGGGCGEGGWRKSAPPTSTPNAPSDANSAPLINISDCRARAVQDLSLGLFLKICFSTQCYKARKCCRAFSHPQ